MSREGGHHQAVLVLPGVVKCRLADALYGHLMPGQFP
jgi:hypothetical protein